MAKIEDLKKGGFLSGYKTYIMVGVGVIGAVAAYLTGEMDLNTTIQTVWGALVAGFLRNGMK